MPDFDIENLIDFHPPRRWCGKCFALWKEHRIGVSPDDCFLVDTKFRFVQCKICNVKYIPTKDYGLFQVGKYIDDGIEQPLSKIDNIIDHGRQLAEIARHMRKQGTAYQPFRSLMNALVRARSFVHFTSYGITQLGLDHRAGHLA